MGKMSKPSSLKICHHLGFQMFAFPAFWEIGRFGSHGPISVSTSAFCPSNLRESPRLLPTMCHPQHLQHTGLGPKLWLQVFSSLFCPCSRSVLHLSPLLCLHPQKAAASPCSVSLKTPRGNPSILREAHAVASVQPSDNGLESLSPALCPWHTTRSLTER